MIPLKFFIYVMFSRGGVFGIPKCVLGSILGSGRVCTLYRDHMTLKLVKNHEHNVANQEVLS